MSKIRVTFKSPDASYYALQNIQDEDEREHAEDVLRKFIENDEYVTIEIDLDTEEAIVVKR